MTTAPGVEAWDAWHPREAARRLAGCPVTWCVAAGWAVDLHLGRATREHSDLEIAIPRAQWPVIRGVFGGFDLYDATREPLRRLGAGEDPDPEGHQVWVCDPAVPAWRMDLFLEPGDEQTWVSHRDERIRVPMRDALRRTPDGIPYLGPEMVLLAKAKHVRDKDEADLAHLLPTLDDRARSWLADAIALAHPGHAWVDRVRPQA
jgi:hypothetical protein